MIKLDRIIGWLAFVLSLVLTTYFMSELTFDEGFYFGLVLVTIAGGAFGLYLAMRPQTINDSP